MRSILLAVRPALEVVPSGCRCCALESKVEAAYSGGAAAAVTGSRKVSVENVVPLAACSGHDTRQLLEGGGEGGVAILSLGLTFLPGQCLHNGVWFRERFWSAHLRRLCTAV